MTSFRTVAHKMSILWLRQTQQIEPLIQKSTETTLCNTYVKTFNRSKAVTGLKLPESWQKSQWCETRLQSWACMHTLCKVSETETPITTDIVLTCRRTSILHVPILTGTWSGSTCQSSQCTQGCKHLIIRKREGVKDVRQIENTSKD